jgi:hypothetical protein
VALTQQQVDQYDVSTGFGMRKVEELQNLGATREQIIDIASRAPIIGDKAAALFPELSNWGSKEKADLSRVPPTFNWIEYVNANPDLDAAGIDTAEEAKRHYALFGYQENRRNAPPPLPSRDERYQTIRTELENQYKALVKLAPAASYQGRSSDLNAIFNQQAAQLADAGVTSIGNLRVSEVTVPITFRGKQAGTRTYRGLIDVTTGQPVKASNLGGEVAVDRDTGVQKWGDIFSGVKGGANYGIQELPDGSVLLFPAWEKTKSPISQIGLSFLEPIIEPIATIVGTVIGGPVGAGVGNSIGQFLASGDVELERALVAAGTAYVGSEISAATGGSAESIGAAVAPEASVATQIAIGEAAINAGVGAGIYAASGGDPLTGAILGAAGSVTSTTYAQTVGKSFAPTATAATQITIGNAILNAGLSGVVAAATGADVSKSMLVGAAKGAAIANTKEIAEAVFGKENIAAVVNATNLTTAQVENIIATSVANGVMAEVANTGEFAETMVNTLVSNGVSTSVANSVVNNINLDVAQEKAIFSATRNLASVATNASLEGKDVGLALEMAAPGAILSGYQEYDRQLAREEEAAQREKELAAVQQPIEVAGPASGQLTQGELATQAARTRGEELVNASTEDGITTYQMTGVRDDGSRYYYKILDIPEVGIKYEFSQIPTDPITLRVLPNAQMGTQVRSEPPDFRGDSTIGLPTTDIIQQLEEVERPTFDPIVIPQDVRQATTRSLIENELQRLENELSNINQQQQAFEGARGQFERLSDLPVGTVDEQLQRQLEDELANLERQATEGQGRISQIERERGAIEGIGTEGGRSLSDEELLGYLETGDLPGGLRGGRPEGEGTAPEGGLGEGGEGEGEGAGGEGDGEGAGGEGEGVGGLEPSPITTPLSPAFIFSQSLPARPETTPFASRVTGEALEGILGEKQPLFGGDDDEQRAVWNRRSLRLLSRALGI